MVSRGFMPLFYVVSGYFFNKRACDGGQFIIKKFKQLMVPYAFWGVFHSLYSFVLDGSWERLRQGIQSLFVSPTSYVPIAGALWFLPALFWINVIYYLLNRLFTNKIILFMVSAMMSFFGMFAASQHLFVMGLDAALPGIIFMATGVILRDIKESKIQEQIFSMKWFVFVPLWIINDLLILFVNPAVNFRTGEYGIYPLTYINAVVAAILLWNFSRFIRKIMIGKLCFLVDVLASIGRNSLIYVALNQWCILYVKNGFVTLADLGGNGIVLQILSRLAATAVVCFICYVVMCVMSGDERLKKCIGK